MMKSIKSMKEFDVQAAQSLQELLALIPIVEVETWAIDPSVEARPFDIVAKLKVGGESQLLICEIKSSGQPKVVRHALLQLADAIRRSGKEAHPLLITPYLSPEAQALCREAGVSYLDLEGNARLAFGRLYIERQVAHKPIAERRELKSLFKPKSAKVLRVMLRAPEKSWRVVDLAHMADVSLGHVSNVRNGLLDREWAKVSDDGIFLSDPDALLDAWSKMYEAPSQRLRFYTTLHGSALESAARQALANKENHAQAAFASFSAADWLASYGRTGVQYFYANNAGLEHLRTTLNLVSVDKGENVVIMMPDDDGIFFDAEEISEDVVCTSALQTYLDLNASGEPGQEAAEYLRRLTLTWEK
jgi:hypothetical protein